MPRTHLTHTVRRRWVEGAVILLWFAVPIIAISMGTSKLYHYAYPFLPPVALAGGYAIAVIAGWLYGWLAKPAALIPGAPGVVVRALVVAAVLLAAMPLTAVRAHIARTGESQLPVRSVRDCLRPIVADTVAAGQPAPGVWVEAPLGLTHVYIYYLRGLGPWQHRDFASDGTVVKNLATADNYRPVLLSRERYDEVMTRLIGQRADLFERVARMTQLAPEVIEQGARDTVIGIIEFPGVVFLLPGPYSACAPERRRLVSP